MKWHETLWQVLRDGGPSTCQFAVTNQCNARCDFCSFSAGRLPLEARRHAPLQDSLEALEILHRQGIRFLVFTGGEPTLHRDLPAMVRRATDLGMATLLVSNGSTLDPDRLEELAGNGLKSMILSIDAACPEAHEANRGLRGVCERIRLANRQARALGVGSTASVTLSRLLEDLQDLPGFLRDLGFESLTFSFPLTRLDSNYLGCAESDLVRFGPDEMHRWIDAAQALKRNFPVLNPTASLEDMRRHVDGVPERFECLGGFKQFYLDWDLMLWRCNNWKTPMCPVQEFDGTQRVRDGCTACMLDCYRDASVLQHAAVSLADGLGSLGRGDLAGAARSLLKRENLVSLGAVLESSFWVRRL